MDPKKGKQIQKTRKPINKLRIYNFFENRKQTQKMRKQTQKKRKQTLKKEETNQQTENLKLFLITGKGPKKRGNGPKKKWKPINKLRIYNFF